MANSDSKLVAKVKICLKLGTLSSTFSDLAIFECEQVEL